jgi:hypothetical protein
MQTAFFDLMDINLLIRFQQTIFLKKPQNLNCYGILDKTGVHMSTESPREERVNLMKQIEQKRKSKVLVYFCADRHPAGSQISADAARTLYEHLLAIAPTKLKNLDLFLYSIGGMVEAPWRIVTMLREFCEKLTVIIPYKAYSAATLIALGSDEIIMSRKGELGPIDPTLHAVMPIPGSPQPMPIEFAVEDISSYIIFIREVAGLTDQSALGTSIAALADKIPPPILGSIQRMHSHIRLVARKLLSLCKPPMEERRITSIVQALTEKIYAHGHGIGRREANEIGLQIGKGPDVGLEELILKLYLCYENLFALTETQDPEGYFASDSEDERTEDDWDVACIETTEKLHVFRGRLRLKRIRQQMPSLNVSVNLPIQFPPNVQPQNLPAALQQALQQMIQKSGVRIRNQILRQIAAQMPVIGVKPKLVGGKWIELT